jgi:hypothetical protein
MRNLFSNQLVARVTRSVVIAFAAFGWSRLIWLLGVEHVQINLFVLYVPWLIILLLWGHIAEKRKRG